MSDKSPRQHMAKKQGKSIKEKRADKRDKANAAASIDPVSRACQALSAITRDRRPGTGPGDRGSVDGCHGEVGPPLACRR